MIIYKTTNLINGKVYIGKDKHNNPKYLGSGKHLREAIKKYGVSNFVKEVLEECTDMDIWLEREKYWISFYNSVDMSIGYNITYGGEGGDTFSTRTYEEQMQTRKKLSKSSTYWNNINRELHSRNTKRLWESETYRQKVRAGIKKSNANPEIQTKRKRIMKEVCNQPEMRQIRSLNAVGKNNSKWIGYAYLYDVNMQLVKRFDCIAYLRQEYPLSYENDKEIRNGIKTIVIKSSRKRKLAYEGYTILITHNEIK